jgi:hypothetical protein
VLLNSFVLYFWSEFVLPNFDSTGTRPDKRNIVIAIDFYFSRCQKRRKSVTATNQSIWLRKSRRLRMSVWKLMRKEGTMR